MAQNANSLCGKKLRNGFLFGITSDCLASYTYRVFIFPSHRKSFQDLPDELSQYRNPKTKAAAEAGALALINPMEIAVCAVMFFSGLRRAEIVALKPDCLS
jgi:hypothetical protein